MSFVVGALWLKAILGNAGGQQHGANSEQHSRSYEPRIQQDLRRQTCRREVYRNAGGHRTIIFFGKEVFHVEKPSKQNCAETNSFHHLPSTTKTPMHAAPESVPVASQHWNHRNVHEMLIKKKQEIRHQSAVSTVLFSNFRQEQQYPHR